MPLKIRYPRQNAKHKMRILIIQGTCDNSAKITGALINKAGLQIQGQPLIGRNPRHWGYLYRNLGKDSYKFTLTQTNSPVETVGVDFNLDPDPPPPVGAPPTIVSPADGDTISGIIYPFGTSNAAQLITALFLSGNGQNVLGTVTQQPDASGDWFGQIDLGNTPAGSGYSVTATNNTGPTTVINLTIQ